MTDAYYRRYTDITSLIGMLANGELTLLDPLSWDDKNDSYFLDQYRKKRGLKSVLALCFSRAKRETYHHWRVFSPGPAGVCVWFREDPLIQAVKKIPGVRVRMVKYLSLNEARRIRVSSLPFVKRAPFEPEHEVRMLWESDTDERTSLSVPFPSDAIARITLSPWLHPSLAEPLKALLRSLPECRHYKILRSTIVGNAEWKRCGRMTDRQSNYAFKRTGWLLWHLTLLAR